MVDSFPGPSEGTCRPWTELCPKGPGFHYRKGRAHPPLQSPPAQPATGKAGLRGCVGPQPLTEALGVSSRAPHALNSLGSSFMAVGSGGDAGTGVGCEQV